MKSPESVIVCHMTSAHQSDDVRIFLKECVTLADAGFNVFLVAANTTEENLSNVQIVSADVAPAGRFSRMLKTSKAVYKKALSLDADIYHFHDPELLRFALRLKRKGKKVIYDAHEDLPRQISGKPWIPAYLRKPLAWIIEKYENDICKRLTHVVVATPTIESRFILVNPNSTAICNYPILSEIDTLPNWSDRQKAICYIGGITVIRGIRELVASLGNLEGINLHLAGVFSPESLKTEVSASPNWNKVIDHGFLNRKGIADILNQSKVGIVTLYPQSNYLESLPIKMFEYMLAGIPVIASDFPLWKNIVETGDCGVCVDPLNPDAISDAILKILSDEQRAEEMGRNGRKAVLERYNWSAEGKKLVNVYLEIASNLSERN